MPIDPVDIFLEKMGYGEQLDSDTIEITAEDFGEEPRIIVLNYED
jgi:hypothetical protein